MTEDQFWAIVDRARNGEAGFEPVILDRLSDLVVRLSDDDLAAFAAHLDAARDRAYDWDLWAAGYLIQGGMSDDGFEDFRSWLISHGRTVFEAALADPDSLVQLDWRADLEDMGLAEAYAYVAQEELGRRGLATVPELGPNDPTGAPFPEDDDEWFDQRFPRLSARVNG